MFGIGPLELVLILVVALLVFGPKRVPELARTLGRSLAEFRRATNDLRHSLSLDDLQNDIRRELSPQQTIHRPAARPGSATAETDAGGARSETDATKAGTAVAASAPVDTTTDAQGTGDAESGEVGAGQDRETAAAGPPPAAHPGELPLGNDHEHHDVPSDPDAEPLPDPELGSVPVADPGPRRKPGRG
jgi:TatA/E family protein of Tat protein translocase